MSATKSRNLTRRDYAEAAEEFQNAQTLENVMEATPQATQRKITLESLDLVHARRPEVQVFNELLVQYPQAGTSKLGQLVPDNMIVVSPKPIEAEGSFDVTLEHAPLFCVLEYVSLNTKRKDFEENMVKYERGLKVPYYLRFDSREQELTLFRHTKRKFVAVKPNSQGRLAVPELDLEVGLLDGWARFWYQGDLLPLPADLQRDLEQMRKRLDETVRRLDETARRLDETSSRLDESASRLIEERLARQAAEEEVARLKAQLEQTRRPKRNGA